MVLNVCVWIYGIAPMIFDLNDIIYWLIDAISWAIGLFLIACGVLFVGACALFSAAMAALGTIGTFAVTAFFLLCITCALYMLVFIGDCMIRAIPKPE